MISTLFFGAKLFLSKLLEFCMQHWRLILVALLLAAIWHYKTHYEVSVKELADFKAEIAAKVEQQERENLAKLNAAKIEVAIAEEQAKAQIEKLGLDRNRETKNLKDLYENRLDATGRNWSERVRLEAMRSDTSAEENTASSTEGSTEGERKCYTAYSVLEAACQITTVDFNLARRWIDAACDQVGCE